MIKRFKIWHLNKLIDAHRHALKNYSCVADDPQEIEVMTGDLNKLITKRDNLNN